MGKLRCKKSLCIATLAISVVALRAIDLMDTCKVREAKNLKKKTKKNKISLKECNGCFVFNFK